MKRILILISLIILTGCSNQTEIKTGKITCEQKNILVEEKNAVIIDVRTKDEYKDSHMKDAINIPYDQIKKQIAKEENINKETPIIVYCKSGARSNKAYNTLIEQGYKNVYDLGALSKCNR